MTIGGRGGGGGGGGASFWAGEGAGATVAGNWTGPFTGAPGEPGKGAETFGDWVGGVFGFRGGVVGVVGAGVEQIVTPLGMSCGVGLTQGWPPVLFFLSLTYFSSAAKRCIRILSSVDSH